MLNRLGLCKGVCGTRRVLENLRRDQRECVKRWKKEQESHAQSDYKLRSKQENGNFYRS